MLVRATRGFAGTFSMYKGQIMECNDAVVLHDLLSCGYIEEVSETAKEMKGGIKNEGKRSKSK